jgi:hypothetical protein
MYKKGAFAARVLFVSEFLARVGLACSQNFRHKSCYNFFSSRASFINKCIAAPFPPTSSIQVNDEIWSNSSSLSLFTRWLALNVDSGEGPLVGNGADRKCRMECQNEIQKFVYSSQCCAKKISSVQHAWAALVLPNGVDGTRLDVSHYLCMYDRRNFPIPVNERRVCTMLKEEIVWIFPPPKTCTSNGKQTTDDLGGLSLSCAMSTCSLIESMNLPQVRS